MCLDGHTVWRMFWQSKGLIKIDFMGTMGSKPTLILYGQSLTLKKLKLIVVRPKHVYEVLGITYTMWDVGMWGTLPT